MEIILLNSAERPFEEQGQGLGFSQRDFGRLGGAGARGGCRGLP